MKKSFLFLIILCLSFAAKAQQSTDYGLFLGMGQEHAETILPVPYLKTGILGMYPAAGAYYRRNYNPRYGLRIGVNYGFNSPYHTRLLTRQTPIIAAQPQLEAALLPIDLHALFEINFLPLNPKLEKPKVSTFVAAGVGVNQLRPVIPFVVGVKYRATKEIGLSVEWKLHRKVINDNIDVLSNSSPSNWFSYIGITAHYNVIKTCKTCPFYESDKKRKR